MHATIIGIFALATRIPSRHLHPTRGTPKPTPTPHPLAPGARLLCIDDSRLHRRYRPGPPARGKVYCLREAYSDHGRTGVLLVGIAGPRGSNGLEQGFYLSRFRILRH